jgi:hypothetical protein
MASQSDYLGLFAQPQQPAGLFAPPQQAAGMFAQPQASMRPYQPTIREQLGNAVYDFMMARGLPSTAEQYRGVAQGAADFVPGLGEAVGTQESAQDYQGGRYLDAALGAGGVMLGAVPVVGDAAAKGVKQGIKAYHGSPHDFDRFSMEHIGKGEGAQVYGHGLYFAENEATAKSYRDILSSQSGFYPDGRMFTPDWDDPGYNAIHTLHLTGGDYDKAIEEARKIKEPDWRGDVIKTLEQYRQDGVTLGPKGRMYEVSINADPDEFLDWDKPLSDQSEKVKGALRPFYGEVSTKPVGNGFVDLRVGGATIGSFPADKLPDDLVGLAMKHDPRTGGQIYESQGLVPGEYRDKVSAAEKLRNAGIKGIRYLDQGSRGKGDGTRNFVVFDDATIEILRKYGILAPLAGTAAAGAMTDDSGT